VPWAALALVNLVALPTALEGLHARDTDLFYHLAGGRYMVEQRAIMDTEVFSFTAPGVPWTNYFWLFEVVLYGVYAVGGYGALIALRAVLVLATASLLLAWCHRRAGGQGLVALAVTLLAFGLYGARATNIRPHLASYLFLLVALFLLDRLWRRPGALEPWLPLLAVLWASLHGVEYPVFLIAVAVHAGAAWLPRWRTPLPVLLRDRDVLRWPVLLALSAAAFWLNPFGPRLYGMALMGTEQDVMRYIHEMQPYAWRNLFTLFPEPHLAAGVLFHYLVGLALLALPDWVRRRDARAIGLVGVSGALAVNKSRFMPEFAILGAGFVAEGLAGWRRADGRRPAWLTGLLGGVVAFVVVAAGVTAWTGWQAGRYRLLSPTAYPVGPVRFLAAEGLGGNVFCEATVAGYLQWALAPGVRVFMDMRTPQPFDGEVFWLYREVAFGRDPAALERLEARWPIDAVLLPRDSALARALPRQPDGRFALAWADDQFVLFLHRRHLGPGAEHRALRVLDPFDPTLGYVTALADPGARAALGREAARLRAVWPENHLAHVTALALLLREGAAAEAAEQAARLARAFPGEARYPFAAGQALRALGRDAAALAAFERALALDPDLVAALPAAGEVAFDLGRAAAGRGWMEEYRTRKRDRLSAAEYLLLGNLRYRTGAVREAARAYERALWVTADEGGLRARLENNLGSALLDLGDPARALPLLEAALRRLRPFPEAELNRARAWLALGRAGEARAALERLAEDPGVPADLRARARARLGGAAP
jgi:tetratricopeptide (TPR) repeat protein